METEIWEPAPTEDQIVDFCLRMKPDEAAVKADSSLCVTPLINSIMVNGETIPLKLIDDKWLSHNIRVSGQRQRSGRAKERVSKPQKELRQKDEGFSEEEQVRRGIRHCIQQRLAFKIYSDAGVTGEFPNNDQALIYKLLKKKAARYKRIYTKVLLDEASLSRRSPCEIVSMQKYLEERCASILRAGITDDEAYNPAASEGEIRGLRLRRGRPRKRVYYRQGFSQIWLDVAAKLTHTVTACDSSRICRDADLDIAFLQHLSDNGASLVGLVENRVALDVSDQMNKGMLYLLASYNESKLVETATQTFRGSVQRLESGRHTGRLPWWIKTDNHGFPHLVPESVEIVKKILDLYLTGKGPRSIGTRLIADGDLVDGKILTDRQVAEVMGGDTIAGKLLMYGLEWNVLPPAITDHDILAEMNAMKEARKDALPHMAPKFWTEHLFTGIVRCTCGVRMQFQAPDKKSAPGSEGTYRCLERHGDLKGSHATVDARKLTEFICELVSENPNLLSGALAGSLVPGSSEARVARRALLEAALKQAEANFAIQESAARTKAEQKAIAFGVTASSDGYIQVVEGLVRNEVAAAAQELDMMRAEIARLRAETSRKSRDEKMFQSLAELQDWESLDVVTKNRLLRSLFEDIIVYPRKCENKIELKLHGLSEPLAPIYLRHANRESVRLPSVAEWLEDTCSSISIVRRRPPSVNAMRSLNECWNAICHIEGAERLWNFCHENKISKTNKSSLKWYRNQFCKHNADADMMITLEAVYQAYVESEGERLSALPA